MSTLTFQQEYISISLGILFGLYATYTDFKTGKILNLCSFGLLWAGVVSQLMFVVMGVTTLKSFVLIFTVSAALSFGAYWLGVFAPGDAKLYWGSSLLLPSFLFGNEMSLISFPPVVLLMNLLFIYFCWTLLHTLLFTPLKDIKYAFFLMFSEKDILRKLPERGLGLLQFLAIAFYVSVLLSQFQLKLGMFFTLLLIIALHIGVRFLAKKLGIDQPWQTLLIVLPCVMIALMTPGFLFLLGWRFLVLGTVYILLLPLLLGLFLNLDSLKFSKSVDVDKLQPGMIPAESILRTEGENGISYKKEPALISRWHDDNVIIAPQAEGLSAENIQELQTLASQGHFESFENKIMVQHSSHFALFILLGFILTIILKGPFYIIVF